MSKDLSSDKQSDKYFDAKNIRILSTDQKSTFSVTNEAGNEIIFSIPSPSIDLNRTSVKYTVNGVEKYLTYSASGSSIPRCIIEEEFHNRSSGTQVIIGTKEMRDSAIIVTTDDNGFDCFWELENINDGDFELELLYMANLGLSKSNLVQLLYNYENSSIQKVYFVDGAHQLRFFNIRQKTSNGDSINLIDLNPSSIDVVSEFDLSQPRITSIIGGGNHTSGMVQYAYGLYILNGAQTTISPVSELKAISKGTGLGGGEVNEVLGKSVSITIPSVDTKFTNIKIYSIKYTSYNQNPEINIVADKQIDNFDSFTFIDDGSSVESISLESFIFLGSSPIIPKHITTKDNRLFPINITEQPFNVDLDCRAYSFSDSSDQGGVHASVLDRPVANQYGYVNGVRTNIPASFEFPEGNDCINADYDAYKYKSDGVTLGASGKYVEVEIVQSSLSDSQAEDLQFFKDRELYRLGIKFYNRLGQTSDPKWIMDLKAPEGNVTGNYNQLKVSLTSEFTSWINDPSNFPGEDDVPVGYKILRADRSLNDQTIYAQGFINPMISHGLNRDKAETSQERRDSVNSDKSNIIPSMTRMFESMPPFLKCTDFQDLSVKSETNSALGYGNKVEGFKSASGDDWRAQSFQHNRLMQFFSPEVLFRDNEIDSSYVLNIVGLIEQTEANCWSAETNPVTGIREVEAKFIGGFTNGTPGVNPQEITSNPSHISDHGFFGPTNGSNTRAEHQVYREFGGDFHPSSGSQTKYDIYGTPELTQEGADFTVYNNDYQLRYSNNLKTMLMDNWADSRDAKRGHPNQVRGCATIGAKCITFAEGRDDPEQPIVSRQSIESIHNRSNIGATKGVMIAEFVKPDSALYVGGMYGGMSYESKRNSSYIEIGSYSKVGSSDVFIESPGDTFVGMFTFTKMVKTDTEETSKEFNLVSEIVSIRLETSIDLKNRNDLSLGSWDNRYQPKYEEYQEYNNVYSQQPTLVKSVDTGAKLKKIQEFDGRIISSKEKIPGEFIDSWTDFLENETMDLDGKYGPINAVVNLKDEIFCLQDTAVAHIAINPRAQVQSQDGIALELGTGGILHDYMYKSTTIGSLNKWGTIVTENAFYFVDAINKGIMTFDGKGVGRLSDVKGFHHELLNRLDYNDLRVDNSILSTGVSLGHNPVNSDVYFSFKQSTDSFTLAFNEQIGEFVSYYDYVPSWYINKGSVMISTDPSNTEVWEHFKGVPNHFYGNHFPSSVTMHLAPQGNEIILNNASYKMELTDALGQEVLGKGLTGVRVYNDYQDSGLVGLVNRQNVFKKFRNWKINFPRNKDSRERVRSAWCFAEFSFNNTEGNKLILHDITIFFTQH
mgnify:CR=1 FL=1